MSQIPTIESDVPCKNCGYNLRGLSVDHICPECGEPIRFSAHMALANNANELRHYFRSRHVAAIARSVGYSVDAVMFVQDAVSFSMQPGHRTAREVCRDFADYARQYFNDRDEAIELLREWGVCRSEDVGRIVFGLVRAGMLVAGPEDREEDFAGLFTLENLLHSSAPQVDSNPRSD